MQQLASTVASTVLATLLLVGCLFGVLLVFGECFGGDGPSSFETTGSATPAASLTPTRVLPQAQSQNDGAAATSTPQATGTPADSTPTVLPVTPTLAPASPASTPMPAPPVQQPAVRVSNFSGNWRVVDTVTSGEGTGQTYTFDITLSQTGDRLQGGNGGITINGIVEGSTASATFTQQDLSITGTFVWTLTIDGSATGSFSTSVPNSGPSQLLRR